MKEYWINEYEYRIFSSLSIVREFGFKCASRKTAISYARTNLTFGRKLVGRWHIKLK